MSDQSDKTNRFGIIPFEDGDRQEDFIEVSDKLKTAISNSVPRYLRSHNLPFDRASIMSATSLITKLVIQSNIPEATPKTTPSKHIDSCIKQYQNRVNALRSKINSLDINFLRDESNNFNLHGKLNNLGYTKNAIREIRDQVLNQQIFLNDDLKNFNSLEFSLETRPRLVATLAKSLVAYEMNLSLQEFDNTDIARLLDGNPESYSKIIRGYIVTYILTENIPNKYKDLNILLFDAANLDSMHSDLYSIVSNQDNLSKVKNELSKIYLNLASRLDEQYRSNFLDMLNGFTTQVLEVSRAMLRQNSEGHSLQDINRVNNLMNIFPIEPIGSPTIATRASEYINSPDSFTLNIWSNGVEVEFNGNTYIKPTEKTLRSYINIMKRYSQEDLGMLREVVRLIENERKARNGYYDSKISNILDKLGEKEIELDQVNPEIFPRGTAELEAYARVIDYLKLTRKQITTYRSRLVNHYINNSKLWESIQQSEYQISQRSVDAYTKNINNTLKVAIENISGSINNYIRTYNKIDLPEIWQLEEAENEPVLKYSKVIKLPKSIHLSHQLIKSRLSLLKSSLASITQNREQVLDFLFNEPHLRRLDRTKAKKLTSQRYRAYKHRLLSAINYLEQIDKQIKIQTALDTKKIKPSVNERKIEILTKYMLAIDQTDYLPRHDISFYQKMIESVQSTRSFLLDKFSVLDFVNVSFQSLIDSILTRADLNENDIILDESRLYVWNRDKNTRENIKNASDLDKQILMRYITLKRRLQESGIDFKTPMKELEAVTFLDNTSDLLLSLKGKAILEMVNVSPETYLHISENTAAIKDGIKLSRAISNYRSKIAILRRKKQNALTSLLPTLLENDMLLPIKKN